MPLKYTSGEEVLKGDRVLFHREPGEIVLVVDAFVGDGENDWHMKEHGPGVMIREPKYFEFVYIPASDSANWEDLEFVGRVASG